MKVTNLDDHRPHISIVGRSGGIHVFPRAMVDDIINGKLKFTDVEDWEDMIPTILAGWLEYISE